MKILHLTYTAFGGAGIAALRQHNALRAAGIESMFLSVTGEENPAQAVYSLEHGYPNYRKLNRQYERHKFIRNLKTRWQGKTPELFTSSSAPWNIENHPLMKQADIVHLHWVSGMIDLRNFFERVRKPIVWTMHDAWPFTGGFHYEKYWNSETFSRYSATGLEIRKQAFAGLRTALIFPSNYLLNLCNDSGVFPEADFFQIDNCVDEKYILNRGKREINAKKDLTFLYASGELNYFRKGFDIAQKAFNTKRSHKHQLQVLGISNGVNYHSESTIDFRGYTHSTEELIKYYSNSDFLIHTSREDNQPNVIAEALCCGTPVIATPAGGVNEMINSGENGILLNDFSSDTLSECLDKIQETEYNRTSISENAIRKYAPSRFVTSVMEIYSGL